MKAVVVRMMSVLKPLLVYALRAEYFFSLGIPDRPVLDSMESDGINRTLLIAFEKKKKINWLFLKISFDKEKIQQQ